MDRISVNWVIQSLSFFFNEWENPRTGFQLPLPCAQFSLVKCAEWWRSLSAPPLVPPQNLWSACLSCGAGLWHFAATGLWMFWIVCLYFQGYSLKIEGANRIPRSNCYCFLIRTVILCLDSYVALVFLTFISLVRCFQVGFSVRNPHGRGVYVKRWVSKVCLTQRTSETFP